VNKPRLLLADDHTLVLEGLKSLLASHVDLVGAVADGRELISAAEQLKPDVIVLDISMPGLNGIEAARRLRKSLPGAKLVLLTMHGDPAYVNEALRLGVAGYVLKRSAFAELVTAIQEVVKGLRYVTPLLKVAPDPALGLRGETGWAKGLTGRQREVLQLVAEGLSAKEVASILRISVKTAEFHKANLMRRLGLHTTAELTKYALRHRVTGK
jgi:DNA-binding NarL/FixJ family response regulator